MKRSRQRRWSPSEGEEWVHLTQSTSWASAWLTCRFLLDGLPGTASHRLVHLRGVTQCWASRQACQPKWRWLSPADSSQGRSTTGVAWCADCCQNYSPCGTPEQQPHEDGLETWPGPPFPRRGSYTLCPLFGQGEAGSEHAAIFCPAIRAAWRTLCPDYPNWWQDAWWM